MGQIRISKEILEQINNTQVNKDSYHEESGKGASRKSLAHELHELRVQFNLQPRSKKSVKRREARRRSNRRYHERVVASIERDKKDLERVRKNSELAKPTAYRGINMPTEATRRTSAQVKEMRNISSVINLQRELENLRLIKNEDPNSFDRAAMK
ncbi:MAG: hypothetical protein MJ154_03005 [Candidatus Saccharibacteria bacterium]|nr:hypothetical protein [Candidatus Saccharibacteria bacterium]